MSFIALQPRIGKAAAIAMYLGGFVCLQRAEPADQRAKLQLLCAAAGGFTWLQALGSSANSNRHLHLHHNMKPRECANAPEGDFLDKGYHSWLGGKVFLAAALTALDSGVFGWMPRA